MAIEPPPMEFDRGSPASDDEWRATISALDRDGRRNELWSLARTAPPMWAARALGVLTVSGWRPPHDADHEEFDELCTLAAACDAIPLGRALTTSVDHCCDPLAGDPVDFVAFSPDGALLATSGFGGEVLLHRTADATLHAALGGHSYVSPCLAFAPAGDVLAVAANHSVNLWRTEDCAHYATLKGHTGDASRIAFSPDGDLLATVSRSDPRSGRRRGVPEDRTVRLWRTADGALTATLSGHRGSVQCLAFSPLGDAIATGSDSGRAWLWRTADGTQHSALKRQKGGVRGLAFSPDGALLATVAGDGAVRLWRTSDASLHVTLEGHPESVSCLAFGPDGALLAAGGRDGAVRLWRMPDASPHARLEGHPGGHSGGVSCLAFSPDGGLLATGYHNANLGLWRVGDDATPVTHGGQTAGVPCLAFSADGGMLAIGSKYFGAQLWLLWDGLVRRAPLDFGPAELEAIDERRGDEDVPTAAMPWLELTAALARRHRADDVVVVKPNEHRVVAVAVEAPVETTVRARLMARLSEQAAMHDHVRTAGKVVGWSLVGVLYLIAGMGILYGAYRLLGGGTDGTIAVVVLVVWGFLMLVNSGPERAYKEWE